MLTDRETVVGPLLIALAGVQLAAMSSGGKALAQSPVCAVQMPICRRNLAAGRVLANGSSNSRG